MLKKFINGKGWKLTGLVSLIFVISTTCIALTTFNRLDWIVLMISTMTFVTDMSVKATKSLMLLPIALWLVLLVLCGVDLNIVIMTTIIIAIIMILFKALVHLRHKDKANQ